MISTQRLLLGACLLAGRTSGFNVPVASSLSGHARSTLVGVNNNLSAVHRRVSSARVLMATAPSGPMQGTIETRITQALSPVHLEVINESHMHSGPATESHFKVVVVSDQFEGKSLLARHRMVNALFAEDMTGKTPKMHALSIQGKTPSQWESEGHRVAPSPPCMGGSKADTSMGSEALAAAVQGGTQGGRRAPAARARRRHRRGKVESFSAWRQRRPVGFGTAAAAAAAGLFACAFWLSYPGSAAAAAAKAGERAAESIDIWGEVDKAFWMVADQLGSIVNRKNINPMAQCMVMFHTAWMTTSVCPIACAGAMEQPLGRAMIATATSHAAFAALKFSLAVFAMSSFPPVQVKPPPRRPDGGLGVSKPASKPAPKSPAYRNKPPTGRPALRLPPTLVPNRRGSPATAPATTGAPSGKTQEQTVTRIQVRRSAKSVPKLWLMAMTAVAGPSWGAVGSAVAWKAGLVGIPAALSSLSRGSVVAVLVAGSLCYGGAGTGLVARWAVFQGVFGAPLASLLTPSALIVVYMCNYYWRVVASRRRAFAPPPGTGMPRRGGAPGARGKGESDQEANPGATRRRSDAAEEMGEEGRETQKEGTAEEDTRKRESM